MTTLETSLLAMFAQLHVPLWRRSASHGISERLLDHTPQFMTALLPEAITTFCPPWERGECVDDVVQGPGLEPWKLH